jgi:calmodulin
MVQLREILAEVDPNLSTDDLDGIISEIDEDGSGKMGFEDFCEMMMTSPVDE